MKKNIVAKGFGFVNTSNQLEIKSNHIKSKFNKTAFSQPIQQIELAEYVLNGLIAFIEATAQTIANEQNLVLKSLQLEVEAFQYIDQTSSFASSFFPFHNVQIKLLPNVQEELEVLEQWVYNIKKFINLPEEVIDLQLSEKLVFKNIA